MSPASLSGKAQERRRGGGKAGAGRRVRRVGRKRAGGSRSPPPCVIPSRGRSHNQGATAGVGSQTQRVWAPVPPSLLSLARWGKKTLPCSLFASLPPSFPPFLPPSCLSCSLAIQSIIHDQIFCLIPPSLSPSFPHSHPSFFLAPPPRTRSVSALTKCLARTPSAPPSAPALSPLEGSLGYRVLQTQCGPLRGFRDRQLRGNRA